MNEMVWRETEHQDWRLGSIKAMGCQIDFGMYDAKGREIGAWLKTWHDPRNARPFALYAHATRNALTFGAVQPRRYFATEDERRHAIDRYLAGARKRALRAGL